MSTYKVIQDIEAEDKLLGPLTLRQFIFAIVAVMCYYFCYLLLSHHAGILTVIFLPPALFATFFAIPFGGDQPTEVWALAKIRFYFKPRRRIWDQSGVKDLVTVNAPKKVEEVRTNGLSQGEVRSRLSALANTIDSRGWAVKNVNLNVSVPTPGVINDDSGSDRLLSLDGLPQDVPETDINAADDILDEQNNPIAQQFEQMIAASTQAHREQIRTMMAEAGQPTPAVQQAKAVSGSNYWFTRQPLQPSQASTAIMAAEPTAEEAQFATELKAKGQAASLATARLKSIQPVGTAPVVSDKQTAQNDPATASTPPPKPAILELAKNNDLNVATIARQASKTAKPEADDGEVVIALR